MSKGVRQEHQGVEHSPAWAMRYLRPLGWLAAGYPRKKRWGMDPVEIILIVVVAGLALAALLSGGPGRLEAGGRETLKLLSSVWLRLLLGFALAGLILVLMPAGTVGRYLGEQSGFTGLIIATVAGSLAPGGALIQFPVVASLQRSGASPGPLAAYLTAWWLMPLQRTIVWEVPFLGLPFVAARLIVSLAAPFLAGLCVPLVLKLLTR
jgi:hypothetical protein